MSQRIIRNGLQIDSMLFDFIEAQALPETGISPDTFWRGFAGLINALTPQNRALLAHRSQMQNKIDAWHIAHKGQPQDMAAYKVFLAEIDYLVPEGPDFTIDTQNTDPEIATIPGPQLVVPVMNARYALNAANARWGSLYDALYGTDVLGDLPPVGGFDEVRGARVVAWAKGFLDQAMPLDGCKHADVTAYSIEGGVLRANGCGLIDPAQCVGYLGAPAAPDVILLKNNGLHVEIHVDAAHHIGVDDPASVADIRLESALSVIMDCEDSVAAVDAADKTLAYSNWLGLMKGDLVETVQKAGKAIERRLNEDVKYIATTGGDYMVKSRALMLVRNVGHLMTNSAILDANGDAVFEGLMDAMITTLCAMHDLKRGANSATQSVYVVKPKMHGPDEVAFADAIFTQVEAVLGLPANTVKLGIMDEERRTSVNLKECIRAARHRVAFINTGFLDRTGDEIHTSMAAGVMVRKGAMKTTPWIAAYEDNNVDVGLACGLRGRAQIGKGMWAMPGLMVDMLAQKIAHPKSGADCAWVPSPTAATLHATHYHEVDVLAVQDALAKAGARAELDDILTIPLALDTDWSRVEIQEELDNNAQGILGYVVRWIDQGIGCSTVPDIHDIGLMEDRATCRISSQHMANWLYHDVVNKGQIIATFERMARVVDGQNGDDPLYTAMAPQYDNIAYISALNLVLQGVEQPSGYTEPLLHKGRLVRKAQR
ncbi:MAG: malate synthase G [Paracoccaceae bacterium]